MTGFFIKRRECRHRHTKRRDNVKTQREDSHAQAKERGTGTDLAQTPNKTKLANTLILDLWLQNHG